MFTSLLPIQTYHVLHIKQCHCHLSGHAQSRTLLLRMTVQRSCCLRSTSTYVRVIISTLFMLYTNTGSSAKGSKTGSKNCSRTDSPLIPSFLPLHERFRSPVQRMSPDYTPSAQYQDNFRTAFRLLPVLLSFLTRQGSAEQVLKGRVLAAVSVRGTIGTANDSRKKKDFL